MGEIAYFRNGKGLNTEFYTVDGKYPVWGSNGKIARTDKLLNEESVVVIGRVGAYCGSVYAVNEPNWITDNAIIATPKDGVDLNYLYYRLNSLGLIRVAVGSAQPLVTQGGLKVLDTVLPPLPEQKAIARILGSLDDKIELNRQMNRTLEDMAQAIFKAWFVDFKPITNSQLGITNDQPTNDYKFIDSPLGPIPEGWRVGKLGEVIEIFDSERVPLNSRQREERKGDYRYFGATGVMDYINDYLFDGDYVLIGEDGSVIDDYNHPITQFVTGKFWVNNHAHILKGKNHFSNEQLYLFFKQLNIRPFVTGAVQLKINQKNLKSIPLIVGNDDVLINFKNIVQPLFKKIFQNEKEIETLTHTRDTLLPKLVSGEIGVN